MSTFTRIKTNGSLPKEKRPQDFNGYLNGHTNNINGIKTSPPETMFSFESTYGPAGKEIIIKNDILSRLLKKIVKVHTFVKINFAGWFFKKIYFFL